MPDSYVCSGAMMKCTMGTAPAKLTVLPTRTIYLAGQPQANISDHQTMVNLAPFGLCRSLAFPPTAAATAAALGTLTPMPCMHNTPAPWFVGKMDYLIKGQPALLKSCKCQCMWGGTISLVTDGQVGEGTQYVQKRPKQKFMKFQSSFNTSKDGALSDKFDKAVQYHEQGMGVFESVKKANHDVNFKNSKNKEGWMSDDDADKRNSNIKYGKNDQYGINCATTTTAFMLRKKGYDITARARNANAHTDSIAFGLNIYDAWRNPDGSAVTPTMLLDEFNAKVEEKKLSNELNTLESTKAELLQIKYVLNNYRLSETQINQLQARFNALKPTYFETRKKLAPIYKEVLMDACQEEGYYTFGLVWEAVNVGGGHYTVIKSEKDKDGNTILTNIEPQTGEPLDFDTLINYLDYPPDSEDTIMRTDDKVFNEEYNDLFDIN